MKYLKALIPATIVASIFMTAFWEYYLWPINYHLHVQTAGEEWLVNYLKETFILFIDYLWLTTIFVIILGIPAIYFYKKQNLEKLWQFNIGALIIGVLVYLILIGPVDMLFNFSEVVDITADFRAIIEIIVMLCVSSIAGVTTYWKIIGNKA
jgi:hypothetical protein